MVRSTLPDDTSSIANQTVAVDFHPTLKTVRGTLGQVMVCFFLSHLNNFIIITNVDYL